MWKKLESISGEVVNVKFNKVILKFYVTRKYTFDRQLAGLTLQSLPINDIEDDEFPFGLTITWTKHVNDQINSAYISRLGKKPSHGFKTGMMAIEAAIFVSKKYGTKRIFLHDASSKRCSTTDDEVSLKLSGYLTQGNSWYIRHGFNDDTLINTKLLKKIHNIRTLNLYVYFVNAMKKLVNFMSGKTKLKIVVCRLSGLEFFDREVVDINEKFATKLLKSYAILINTFRDLRRSKQKTFGNMLNDLLRSDKYCSMGVKIMNNIFVEYHDSLIHLEDLPESTSWEYVWWLNNRHGSLYMDL